MIAKAETQVFISQGLLDEIARLDHERDISLFFEQALVHYIAALKRREQSRRDIEIINANAERFNKDAEENLEFQTIP